MYEAAAAADEALIDPFSYRRRRPPCSCGEADEEDEEEVEGPDKGEKKEHNDEEGEEGETGGSHQGRHEKMQE